MMIPAKPEPQFLYFASEEAEGKVIYEYAFVSLRIPDGAITTEINCKPGDKYYGQEYWWLWKDGAWTPIDNDFIPNHLRTARLLMEGV